MRCFDRAHVMQAKGEAEAAAVMAKGRAEAEVLQKKADAFKHYGEAALVQLIVDKLPEIAQAMAAPLAKTDKMVFVSTDGTTGSRVTADIGRMMAQLPEVVEGVTGVNINTAMQKLAGPAAGAFIAITVLASALSAGNLQAIQARLFEPKQRRHGTVFLQQTDLVYLHS